MPRPTVLRLTFGLLIVIAVLLIAACTGAMPDRRDQASTQRRSPMADSVGHRGICVCRHGPKLSTGSTDGSVTGILEGAVSPGDAVITDVAAGQ